MLAVKRSLDAERNFFNDACGEALAGAEFRGCLL
jgi:hypothetical protein